MFEEGYSRAMPIVKIKLNQLDISSETNSDDLFSTKLVQLNEFAPLSRSTRKLGTKGAFLVLKVSASKLSD
jgi:hypothetical protein